MPSRPQAGPLECASYQQEQARRQPTAVRHSLLADDRHFDERRCARRREVVPSMPPARSEEEAPALTRSGRTGASFTRPSSNQAGAMIRIYTDGSITLNHGESTGWGRGTLNTRSAQVFARGCFGRQGASRSPPPMPWCPIPHRRLLRRRPEWQAASLRQNQSGNGGLCTAFQESAKGEISRSNGCMSCGLICRSRELGQNYWPGFVILWLLHEDLHRPFGGPWLTATKLFCHYEPPLGGDEQSLTGRICCASIRDVAFAGPAIDISRSRPASSGHGLADAEGTQSGTPGR